MSNQKLAIQLYVYAQSFIKKTDFEKSIGLVPGISRGKWKQNPRTAKNTYMHCVAARALGVNVMVKLYQRIRSY